MKILIVKTSSLGDIIHAYPTLSYLKHKFPNAIIDFVVEKPFAELVLNHPIIRKVIQVETKAWRKNFKSALTGINRFRKEIREEEYDVCFDLQGNMKSGFIVSQVKSKHKVGFGFKTAMEWPNCLFNQIRLNPPKECNVREENLDVVKQYFKDSDTFDYTDLKVNLKVTDDERKSIDELLLNPAISNPVKVMVCPGSIWKNKQVPKDAMIRFLTKVKASFHCSFIFVWGSPKEKEYAEELLLNFIQDSIVLDKLSLSALQNLMSKMQLVIAMDSLPLHLAGTTSVPTFSFFGPSRASKFMPVGDHHQAFQGLCPYGREIKRRCPIIRTCKTGACLRDASDDELFKGFSLKL